MFFTQIDPNTLQIIGPVTADDTRAHRAFGGQGYGSWPTPGIGIAEEGRDLARCICGRCGNLTPPAEECQGCSISNPEWEYQGCPDMTCGRWCRSCEGCGLVDLPFAKFRPDLDRGLDAALIWAQSDRDFLLVVPPPSGWFQPMSVHGLGGAA